MGSRGWHQANFKPQAIPMQCQCTGCSALLSEGLVPPLGCWTQGGESTRVAGWEPGWWLGLSWTITTRKNCPQSGLLPH